MDILRKDWLILGKGPSYRHVDTVDLSDFYVCSLNHVVREQPVDLAHIIDIDVVEDCHEAIEKHARFLVLPFHPHVNHDPTSKTVLDFLREIPVLRSLADQGRLVWYNLSTGRPADTSPVITARFFSAEAVVNILAICGVKRIRTLGVDGGRTYAGRFEDLATKTLLANRHSSFDRQFEEIAKTIRTRALFYAPLHKEAPIRVFVGTDETQRLAMRVLEYSIKKHTSMSVEVTPMCGVPVPEPGDPSNRPRTGFSFARFLIPSLCRYRGRAIYLDADMLAVRDLCGLWDHPMGEADVLCAEAAAASGRVRQYSVMVMNCARLDWRIENIVQQLDEGVYDYRRLMDHLCIVSPERVAATLSPEWNSLERYEPDRTCLIHYTDMPTQPWVSRDNPNGDVWYRYLREALDEGFLTGDDLYREVAAGHVSPSLPSWVGLPRPPGYRQLRKTWAPPYRRFSGSGDAATGDSRASRTLWSRLCGLLASH